MVHEAGAGSRAAILRRKLLAGAAAPAALIGPRPGSCKVAGLPAAAPASGKISGGPLPLTVGLGTCLVREGDVDKQVTMALDAGYRLIDTAQRYGNEAGIGSALKRAFANGLQREEVFVTTKIWVDNYGYKKAKKSVQESARKLGLESVDLVLPHWPGVGTSLERAGDNYRLRQETWEALEDLKEEGLVKQIGVSNYNRRHLGELYSYAKTLPSASQFEVHPYNARGDLVDICQQQGIRVNGYSPLGGKGNRGQVTDVLLSDPLLEQMGEKYGKTPAQVILRWHLQRGITPIPKASSEKRIKENYDVFDFALSADEVAKITALDRQKFVVMDSEAFI